MNDNPAILFETDLPLRPFIRGKVRDSYDLGDNLLIIATDRISAFDVVVPNGIPNKGRVLNQLSAFWFNQSKTIVPNHLVANIAAVAQLDAYIPPPSRFDYPANLAGRSMVVRKVKLVPVECVVRGYISGSAWEEYQKSGSVCGLPLPTGLQESEELPEPIFTPTTKAVSGHDLPMTLADVIGMVGQALAEQLRDVSLAVYQFARDYARQRGIIVADTKMEFGLDGDRLILIDELLTPDSSRFWDADQYGIGQSQPSYDKQPVRDWLAASGWDKEPPAPELPSDVVKSTTRRYEQAYEQLTGNKIV